MHKEKFLKYYHHLKTYFQSLKKAITFFFFCYIMRISFLGFLKRILTIINIYFNVIIILYMKHIIYYYGDYRIHVYERKII